MPKVSQNSGSFIENPVIQKEKIQIVKVKRKLKLPPPPLKEKLFSENHPKAFHLISIIMPRIQSIILLIGLISAVTIEFLKGNINFWYDWYRSSVIFPALVEWMTVPNAFDHFANQYGMLAILVGVCMAVFAFTLYRTVWRFFFKDYIRKSEDVIRSIGVERSGAETFEGRLYWREDNILYRIWDRMYRSPERKKIKIWIKSNWFPPINILNPPHSLISIELSREELIEQRGIYEIVGHEKPFRHIKDVRELFTTDEPYSSVLIPLDHAHRVFLHRARNLIKETQKLSLANPNVRLDQLRDGSYPVSDELKDAVDYVREQREET